MISKDKTYKTRDGREVRIYATDGGGDMPVHGSIKMNDGWRSCTWMSDGTVTRGAQSCDLIEVKPRIRRTVWLHIYPDTVTAYTGPSVHVQGSRIACVKVEIDCEEGEGL